jgi:hypothetical protein
VISEQELRELDSVLLPALERHHLRLLAHGLRTLQAAAGPDRALPSRGALEAWAAEQPAIADDPGFRHAFVEQMVGVGVQLERIAAANGTDPLDLNLTTLARWAQAEADRRLNGPPRASPPPG